MQCELAVLANAVKHFVAKLVKSFGLLLVFCHSLNLGVAKLVKSFGGIGESPKVLTTFATARILILSYDPALIPLPIEKRTVTT